jgi:biotin synthase-like enzyme
MEGKFTKEWNEYLRLVLAGTSQIQKDECKRAFYSGAFSLFTVIMKMLDPGTEPTENDLAQMDALKKELDDYFLIMLEKARQS